MIVFLDTSILGAIVNPNPKSQKVKDIKAWAAQMEDAGHQLVVPAIADYELRREFIRHHKTASLADSPAGRLAKNDICRAILGSQGLLWVGIDVASGLEVSDQVFGALMGGVTGAATS